jgi:hypothetical protein
MVSEFFEGSKRLRVKVNFVKQKGVEKERVLNLETAVTWYVCYG